MVLERKCCNLHLKFIIFFIESVIQSEKLKIIQQTQASSLNKFIFNDIKYKVETNLFYIFFSLGSKIFL